MIQPTSSFKDNLQLLPSIEGMAQIVLWDASGTVVATIDNAPGKSGSVRVYNYLLIAYGELNPEAAQHGLEVFGEHTADAKARPGAHTNIDRLFEVIEMGSVLKISPVAA